MNKKLSVFLLILLLSSFFVVLYELPTVKAVDTLVAGYLDQYTNIGIINSVHPTVSGYSASGESFTLGSTNYFITQVQFYCRRVISPTGFLQAQLYAVSGVSGVNATPTGSALAVSDFVSSSVFDSGAKAGLWNFTGVNSYEMQANTSYCVVIVGYNSTFSSTNYIRVCGDDSSPTYAGNAIQYRDGAWGYTASQDYDFAVYGISEKLTSSNEAYTNNENGEISTFSSYWVRSGTINASGFIFSINYGSGYSNDTWVAFNNYTNVWANLTKTLMGSASQLGGIIYYKTFANASNGVWYESAIKSFTLQATVIFYFNSGGLIERNHTLINNGTSTTYTTPTNLTLGAFTSSQYQFLSWNLTNSVASSLNNPYNLSVVNKTFLSCSFAPGGSGTGGLIFISGGLNETDLYIWVILGSCSCLFLGFVFGRKRHR